MSRSLRFAWAVWLVLSLGAAPAQAALDDVQSFYGPLRARDLSAFGYLRLDMRPAYTGVLEPGHWAIESELAYQNTWALSRGVRRYLRTFATRRGLTPADVAAIRQLDGENFLVDLELAEVDITLHRQLTQDLGTYLILSGASYDGGALDGAIEQFHAAFGMSDFRRPAVRRDQINLLFDLKNAQYSNVDAQPRSGLLDPTLGLRYSGLQLPAPWSVMLEAAAKLPLGGTRDWLSTGRTDLGLQATLTRRGARHAVYASLALVDYAGADGALQPRAKWLPTLVVGLDSHLTARTHSIVQLYASPSVYGADETALTELRATKYELSLGLRHQRGSHLWSVAVTENLGSFNNTPDVALQFGWAYRPRH